MRARILLGAVAMAAALARPAAGGDWMVVDPGQGAVPLPGGAAAELSGITWTGGNAFLAVGDNGGPLVELTVDLDSADGSIITASFGDATDLAGSDLEGLAFQPATGNVFVSDEAGPQIRIHQPASGAQVGSVAVPPVFAAIRPNLSLEALAWDAAGGFLWTANEEALSVDGPVSSLAAGTVVRLQRFGADLAPAGQWAYVTDPLPGDIAPPGRDIELSGVPDLVVLPDGTLLVLERALGNGVALRHRLYQVDLAAATDTSALASLAAATYTPVAKTLLWERNVLLTNFEGVTVGPPLADGAFSLLLVSDNGSNLNQALYPLAIRPRVCGDGVVAPPEECDDGNTTSGDGCTAACVAEFCGDGVTNDGSERCDDGNTTDGDGCDAACMLERDVLKCQEAVARAGRAYADGRLKALQACRNQLNRGKLLYRADAPETPLAGPGECDGEARAATSIARAAAKAQATIAAKCDGADLARLSACGATVEELVGAAGGGCLVASHTAAVAALLADQYGTPVTAGDDAVRACQEAIAKSGLKLAGARLRTLQGCRNQFNKGRTLTLGSDGQPLADVTACALEARTAKKLARAGEQLRKGIVRGCSDTAVAALGGTCGAGVDALVSPDGAGGCLQTGTAAAVELLLDAQY